MAQFTGTDGKDRLVGTMLDDVLTSYGTSAVTDWDVLIGGAGADTYVLGGAGLQNYIIHDQGTDGAADSIVGAGAMYHSASLGYQAYADAWRVGDTLFLHLPSKPYRFRDPARPEYNIKIKDHFGESPVETIVAGGVTYQLATSGTGSALADIMAGDRTDDVLEGFEGDDFVFGYHGNDRLELGAGDDHGFGGKGSDTILAGLGTDRVYGGNGRDFIHGEDGHDWLFGEGGRDFLSGGAGNDWLRGGDMNDRLDGGAGEDELHGDAGNDVLIGRAGGDTYVFQADWPLAGPGDDTVIDAGNRATWATKDTLNLRGIYGPGGNTLPSEAYAELRFEKSGRDMILHFETDVGGSVTVRNQFWAEKHDRFFIEQVEVDGGYWTPIVFQIVDGQIDALGDDRRLLWTDGAKLNEVLFGTDGADQIFGGTGTNFIWTGAGADTLVYKVGDGEGLGPMGGRLSHDIIEDFDVTEDHLDFSEVIGEIGVPVFQVTAQDDGDAVIYVDTGNWEVADIMIELRGVSVQDVWDYDLLLV